MKFRIQFKDPDGVYDSIQEAARQSLPDELDEDEQEALVDGRVEKINSVIERYGEYVTIEIDTGANTASVVPNA